MALVLAPVTFGGSEAVAVLAGAVVGFGVTYALGITTIDILKKIEQLESRNPKFVAEMGKRAKEQYEAGKKYAKEHPEQIRTRKLGKLIKRKVKKQKSSSLN